MDQEIAYIESKIMKKEEVSPFLFVSSNLELLHSELDSSLRNILKKHGIDFQSLFHISDDGEAIKISAIKEFIAKWDIKSRFAFQVFVIENISRMSIQAQNACLKFFEEPGEWNIIILTNDSQSGILETILSRVQIISIHKQSSYLKNEFYYSMIDAHVLKTSDELIRYFFSGKLEKGEYLEFLKTLVDYISEKKTYIHILDELHEDISWILKNNLQGKYVVDKYIMKLVS